MRVKQVSIFLENRAGRLDDVAEILGAEKINIRALSLADTADFGILRLIVNKPDEACKALHDKGFTTRYTEVIAVEVPDRPGGLATVLKIFKEAVLNVEYMYAFSEKLSEGAVIIFRIEEIDRAIGILQQKGIKLLTGEEVYKL
ncbi:MAG: ACT domain-containing protein [Gemmatimonadota bacterium]|nr:ACT domain-containing protein [Gemmatimonadota bacterium]